MPPAASAVAAARAAVAAEPDSLGGRLHLASLLLDAGWPAEALPHLEFALERDGNNVEALLQATRACEALGETSEADRFRKLATSLSLSPGASAATAAPAAAAPGGTRLTLADVGGLEHVKQRLVVSFLAPIRNPEIQATLPASNQGGLLMFGPPGCGKTMLGQALAGELQAHFIAAEVAEVAAAEPGSNQDVDEVFRLGRDNRPVVLFFDGLEALQDAPKGAEVTARLAAAIRSDGNQGVFVIGASERPWGIPAALLEPGVFDRRMVILPPDARARAAILRHHLAGRAAPGLRLDILAGQMDGYSGAEIGAVCRAAVARAAAAPGSSRVTREHLEAAIHDVPRNTGAWFEEARNDRVRASAGGMYDDLVVYMRSRRMA